MSRADELYPDCSTAPSERVEGVKSDADAMQVRPRFHQVGEALSEELDLPIDCSFLALELGLELVHPGEALGSG